MRSVFDAFPIVASAMGEQRGVRITQEAGGAYTTGDTINIPPIKDEADPALVRKAWGFLDHESAHVLLTDFPVYSQWAKKVGPTLINIVEDIRIEAAMMDRYPGSRRNLSHLSQVSVDEGEFAAPSDNMPAANLVLAHLLYRGRSRCLGQSALDGYAAEAEKRLRPLLGGQVVDELNRLIDGIPSVSSTDEAGHIALAIKQLLQDAEEQQPPGDDASDSQAGQQGGDGSAGDSSSSSDDDADSSDDAGDSAGGGSSDPDSDSEAEGDASASGSDDSTDQEGEASNGAASGSGEESGGEDTPAQGSSSASAGDGHGGDTSLEGLTDAIESADPSAVDITASVRDALDEAGSSRKRRDACMPGVGLEAPSRRVRGEDPHVIQYLKADAERATLALRKRLLGLLEAQTRTRKTHARSGRRLDARRVHRLKVGDTRLFQRKRSEQGVNTAISLLVDLSDSMTTGDGTVLQGPNVFMRRYMLACEGAWAVTQALKGAKGISTGVIAFADSVKEIKPLGREYSHSPFPRTFGSTDTGGGVMRALQQLLPAREDRKILLILTDGDPDHPGKALEAIKRARQSDVEVLVLGIGELKMHLGADEEATIEDINELPQTMLRMLESRLKAA